MPCTSGFVKLPGPSNRRSEDTESLVNRWRLSGATDDRPNVAKVGGDRHQPFEIENGNLRPIPFASPTGVSS